ncbi:MAG: GHMP family kinase ATP-binding protein [Candidatus Helarchaeota archaeon]
MTEFNKKNALKIINSVAPIRICDIGGWTDTWFSEFGKIFNIGVYPYAEVQVEIYSMKENNQIIIQAENFGDRYIVDHENMQYKHPLIEASIKKMNLPKNLTYQINIFSEAPIGASTGTSSAVSVALIGALNHFNRSNLNLKDIAYTAHYIETKMLNQQSGIQDQICSAFGGINFIDMYKYPYARIHKIKLPNPIWWELERRLILIYLGKSHNSSKMHEKVIKELENESPNNRKLNDLRKLALKAVNAIRKGDFNEFGEIMVKNTLAQEQLHHELISKEARKVIEIAKEYGALGYKINGAGGDGGSLTILCNPLSHIKRNMIRSIEDENKIFKNIPIYLSRRGLRVWESLN